MYLLVLSLAETSLLNSLNFFSTEPNKSLKLNLPLIKEISIKMVRHCKNLESTYRSYDVRMYMNSMI